MTSGKAPLNAPPPLSETLKRDAPEPFTFNSKTHAKLIKFYKKYSDTTKQSFDYFFDSLLLTATWAKDELDGYKSLLTKSDLLAEHKSLLIAVKRTTTKLKNISPEYDRLLGIEPIIEECLDSLQSLGSKLAKSETIVKQQEQKPRIEEYRRSVLDEFTVRVMQVLIECDIKIVGTGCDGFEYENLTVELLVIVSKEINIVLSKLTWRDYIIRNREN